MSTGSTSDLKRATDIARSMVTEYGMSKKLGPMFLGGDQEVFLGRNFNQTHSNFSEEVSALIDNEMREMLESCYAHAASLLTEHRDKLDRLAEILMDREKVDHDQFVAVMEGEKSAETDQAAQAEPENN